MLFYGNNSDLTPRCHLSAAESLPSCLLDPSGISEPLGTLILGDLCSFCASDIKREKGKKKEREREYEMLSILNELWLNLTDAGAFHFLLKQGIMEILLPG